jgi:hypothetical protein
MVHLLKRHAALALALVLAASASCTHKTETPALAGPSTLALSLQLNAIPDSISQDGGSQSAIKITAIGPSGRAMPSVPMRIEMKVNGVPQDYGTLSARTVVTNAHGAAQSGWRCVRDLQLARRHLRRHHRDADRIEFRYGDVAVGFNSPGAAGGNPAACINANGRVHRLTTTCDGESPSDFRCVDQSTGHWREPDCHLHLDVRRR